MGVCGIFRPPVQGGSNELISKFLSSMILYNHPSYFKSGEINSCRLSPLPTIMPLVLATPYDLSFTVKSIEVRLLLRGGGNFHYCKIDPFSKFCSFDTLSDANNTSPICEKQPLSHIFLNKYVMKVPLALVLFTLDASDQSLVKKQSIVHSYLDTNGFLIGRLRPVKL